MDKGPVKSDYFLLPFGLWLQKGILILLKLTVERHCPLQQEASSARITAASIPTLPGTEVSKMQIWPQSISGSRCSQAWRTTSLPSVLAFCFSTCLGLSLGRATEQEIYVVLGHRRAPKIMNYRWQAAGVLRWAQASHCHTCWPVPM